MGVADDLPVFTGDLLDGEGGTFEGVKAPVAADRAGDGEVGGVANLGRRFGGGGCGLERLVGFEGLALLFLGDD